MTASARCLLILTIAGIPTSSSAHDIPDARIDRAIQVVIAPGRLEISYEVSLAELTLVQDLRSLVGPAPASDDRMALFERYCREVAVLNARGFLVTCDDSPIDLEPAGHRVDVEEHPRLTFKFEAALSAAGHLLVRDTNYASSEGSSRLALRGESVTIRGYTGPGEVTAVAARPVWQLTDDEERATKEVACEFEAVKTPASMAHAPSPPPDLRPAPNRDGLAGLLDRSGRTSIALLVVLSIFLGAAHAIQPGHGKALVAAASLGSGGGNPWTAAILAIVTAAAHLSSVLLLALFLMVSRSTRYPAIDRTIVGASGFVIAAVGFWRLGRYFGGHDEGVDEPAEPRPGGWIGVGLAAGVIPCWDAILLLIWADALDRLRLGILLVAGFSLGMGAVLIAVALTASRLNRAVTARSSGGIWRRRLGLLSGAALAVLGSLMVWEPR